MYPVYALVAAVCIAEHSMRIMFKLMIFTSDSSHCRGSSIKSQQQSNVMEFGEIYPLSALDLTLHIVVGVNYTDPQIVQSIGKK